MSGSTEPTAVEEVALAELVNRVLDRGVLVTGEVTISVAGIDLLYLGLQLVLGSTETLSRLESGAGPGPDEPTGAGKRPDAPAGGA